MQAVHGWLSTYERLVNSQNFFSPYLTQEDMSRLGRDYLKVGFYTEVLFVEKGVRFIAINNGIDSANQTDSDFTPFLNIINEWYAKDTSKKIRAVMKSKGEAGEHLCTNPPYGYMKNLRQQKALDCGRSRRRSSQADIYSLFRGLRAVADCPYSERG